MFGFWCFPTISSITMFVPMFFFGCSSPSLHLWRDFAGLMGKGSCWISWKIPRQSLKNSSWNPYEPPLKSTFFLNDILWPLIVWKSSKSSPRTLSAAHSSVKPHRSPWPQGLRGAGAVPWVNSWWVHQPSWDTIWIRGGKTKPNGGYDSWLWIYELWL